MADITHAFHRSFDELPEWNEVARVGGLYACAEMGRAFLGEPTLIAVRVDGELVAVANAMISPQPGTLSRFYEPSFVVGADASMLHPVVYCGVPRGYSSRLLVRARVAADVRGAAIARLVAAARQLGEQHDARLVMFGLVPEADARELLAAAGQHACSAYAAAESLLGPVESWDGYLRTVHTQARKEIRRFTESGIRLQRHALSEVRDLAAGVLVEHERKFDPDASEERIRDDVSRYAALGDRVRVFGAWRGDELIGASMVIEYDGVAYLRWAATKKDLPRDANVYFNISYYTPIREALERGISSFDFGLASLEVKLRRGAHARGLWYVLVPREPLPSTRVDELRKAAGARHGGELGIVRQYRPDDVLADLGYGGELVATTVQT